MGFTEKFLGQKTPDTAVTNVAMGSFVTAITDTETLVTCGAGERIIVRTVFISNVGTSATYVCLWHDPVGTAYAGGTTDGSIAIGNTMLIPPYYLGGKKVLALDMYMVMDTEDSELMCAASRIPATYTAGVTFSVYGAVFT